MSSTNLIHFRKKFNGCIKDNCGITYCNEWNFPDYLLVKNAENEMKLLFSEHNLWQILGGVLGALPPAPMGPNSFIFAQIFSPEGTCVGGECPPPQWVGVLPNEKSWIRH